MTSSSQLSSRAVPLLFAGAVLSSVATVIACGSDTNATGTTTTCSTGAPWGPGRVPPHQATSAGPNLPACIPRCGAGQKYTYVGVSSYGEESLPSGACAYEGETCGMGASYLQECPGKPKEACNYSFYECACRGGEWRCAVVSQGGGACGSCDRDAGASP